MTTYALKEEPLHNETALQTCIRVSEKFKRILTYPEIEELVGGNSDFCKHMRAKLVQDLPHLPALKTQGEINNHDKEHENKGFKKRKCIGPGHDGYGCNRTFVSTGPGNRICVDCKDSSVFHSADDSYSFVTTLR